MALWDEGGEAGEGRTNYSRIIENDSAKGNDGTKEGGDFKTRERNIETSSLVRMRQGRTGDRGIREGN